MQLRALCVLLPFLAASAEALSLPAGFRRSQLANIKRSPSAVPDESRRLVRRRKHRGDHSEGGGQNWPQTQQPCDSTSSAPSATATWSQPPAESSTTWTDPWSQTPTDSWSQTPTDSWSQAPTSTEGAPSASLPTASSQVPTPSSSNSPSPSPTGSTSQWQLVEHISGSSFFDSWDFWSWDDPTHGYVTYVDAGTAWNEGLISIDGQGRAIMKVDTTPTVSSGRKSIRISNKRVWNGGMVLMDSSHMPTGCGTWPAWWQNGPDWPTGGEIDIFEGVNNGEVNQVSLHTGQGCTMPGSLSSGMTGSLTTGSWDSYDCSSANTGNQGCGVMHPSGDNSYGTSFNNNGGGVYAMVWVNTGISVWFFSRKNIPADITSGSPDHTTWGTPVAHFPSDNCDMHQFFYDHYNIFDTTLCGDWAGADGVWQQSCAASTGYATCQDFVANQGGQFTEAYWAVNSVTYYNSSALVY